VSGPELGAQAESETALPRWIAAIIVSAIGLASLVALIWPLVTSQSSTSGLVSTQINESGAAGRISAPAPNFEWSDSEGNVVRLSDFRGKIVLVDFWATSCPPCVREMPALNRVASSEPDVVVVAVAGYRGDTPEKAESFLTELALDRLMLVFDNDMQTATRYGVIFLPTTFFIDRTGVIRHIQIGAQPMNEDQIRTGIRKAR
jgi:peroxiredoxin